MVTITEMCTISQIHFDPSVSGERGKPGQVKLCTGSYLETRLPVHKSQHTLIKNSALLMRRSCLPDVFSLKIINTRIFVKFIRLFYGPLEENNYK